MGERSQLNKEVYCTASSLTVKQASKQIILVCVWKEGAGAYGKKKENTAMPGVGGRGGGERR